MKYTLTFILLIATIQATTKDDDLVDKQALLDYIQVPYSGNLYSGYLSATQDEQTQFHYYLLTSIIEDQQQFDQAPLILWLNGGPGCSSLQGAFNENGPFMFKVNTAQFEVNEYGWTNFAHMLYLESPAWVGYSYGDGEVDDDIVALQNLHALLDFFTRFPEFQNREFYISGESYAGIYIPTLAAQIIKHNSSSGALKINLQGIAVGNGCTHPTECSYASEEYPQHVISFLGRHGIISEKQYTQFLNLQSSGKCDNIEELDQECKDFTQSLLDYLNAPRSFLFNPYNVYGMCWNFKVENQSDRDTLQNKFTETYGGCNDARGLYKIFRDNVWNTMTHISDKSSVWWKCTNDERFIYTRLDKQSYYLYQGLIKSGLRIMHFSGDADSVVPITGTLYWINQLQKELDLFTLEEWRPWYIPGSRNFDKVQNAGNIWILDGLTFITVRGAGHMVPTDKKQASLIMIQNFIQQNEFLRR